jgi:hypothetical protein
MSDCPPIALSGITPEKYRSLLAQAQSHGLNLTGETGSISYQGMDFTWTYDASAQSLTLQCTDKPLLVPCSIIESRIRALIA